MQRHESLLSLVAVALVFSLARAPTVLASEKILDSDQGGQGGGVERYLVRMDGVLLSERLHSAKGTPLPDAFAVGTTAHREHLLLLIDRALVVK